VPNPPVTVGQHVTIDDDRYPGQVFRVDRIKVTKALIQPVNDAARGRWPNGVNVPMTMLAPFDGDPDDVLTTSPAAATMLADLERRTRFTLGVLVTLKRPYKHHTTADLFVVTNTSDKTVSVAKLGGDDGRYIRVPYSGLTIVDPTEVLGAAAA